MYTHIHLHTYIHKYIHVYIYIYTYIHIDAIQFSCFFLVTSDPPSRSGGWVKPRRLEDKMDFSQSAEELLTKLDTYREQLAQVEEVSDWARLNWKVLGNHTKHLQF